MMKQPKKEKQPAPAPRLTKDGAAKQSRTAQDVRVDNVRTDLGEDGPKILGR